MPPTIIDTCCLINLYATGHIEAVLAATNSAWHISEMVMRESLFLRRPDPEAEKGFILEPILLAPLIEAANLAVCTADGDDELALFVDFAGVVDDGEAMCLALAQSRSWAVATDDRKARRIAQARGIPLQSTPEIIKTWADTTKPTPTQLAETLQRIQTFSRFTPQPSTPLSDWWTDSCQ